MTENEAIAKFEAYKESLNVVPATARSNERILNSKRGCWDRGKQLRELKEILCCKADEVNGLWQAIRAEV
jgi:hypothetical protein